MACSSQSEPIYPLQVDYLIDHKGELLITFLDTETKKRRKAAQKRAKKRMRQSRTLLILKLNTQKTLFSNSFITNQMTIYIFRLAGGV